MNPTKWLTDAQAVTIAAMQELNEQDKVTITAPIVAREKEETK